MGWISCWFPPHRQTTALRAWTPNHTDSTLNPPIHQSTIYLHLHPTYLTPLGFAALANPLPFVPLNPPLAAPPLPAGTAPPLAVPIRDGAGVENLGVIVREDVGGFSTKEVSVVLSFVSCFCA